MKLCFECSEYPPGLHGGIGSLVQILARGMVKMGHEVRVAGVYRSSHLGPSYEEDQGVRVWRFHVPRGRFGWLAARRRLFSTVLGWCRSGQVDLIEVPDWGSPAAGWPSLPVPVVARLSGSASFFSREMGRRPPLREFLMEWASLRRADFICSNSSYIAARTQELFHLPSADAIIYTPVDIPVIDPHIQRDPSAVMFAGTLTEKKGVISLVKAWPGVIKACPDAKLQIWGKDGKAPAGGSMQDYLSSLLPATLAHSVHFPGHVPLQELLTAFQKAAVTVLPSYAEGFALTPLHAMAASCPTIYTTRGSGPELIPDNETGLLVNPDQPHEIAKAIVTLLQNRDLAHRVGLNGRKLVERQFSWRALSGVNVEFYRRCLEQFRQKPQQWDAASPSGASESDGAWRQLGRSRTLE